MAPLNQIETNKAPQPVGLYPHARRVGNFLYLSGIGSRIPHTNEIPKSFEEQCHSVFKNIKVILEESGYAWGDLIDITVFLTNMKEQFSSFNKIYADYFQAEENRPCRTTVEVGSLPTPIDIELKCVAYKK